MAGATQPDSSNWPPAELLSEMRMVRDRQPADASGGAQFRQAEQNSRLAAEAFFRSRIYIDGWLAHADPQSGLIPRNMKDRYWKGRNAAADNYPFMGSRQR